MASVGIIGGGIIGLSSAWYLQEAGFDVTILDKGDFTDGCSYGNAGMIVPSHFIPLSAPGMMWKGIKWLFNNQSPFAIKPGLDPDLIKWLYNFQLSATKKNVEKAIPHLAEISLLSKSLWQELSNSGLLNFQLIEKGILMLYKTSKTGAEEKVMAKRANSIGIKAQVLSENELSQFDPNVVYNAKGGIYFPGDAHLHPSQFMASFKEVLVKKGVKFHCNKKVDNIRLADKKVEALLVEKEEWSFDHYLVCSGTWTTELMKKIRITVPVVSGKGYSFVLPNNIGLQTPSLLLDHKISVTPMGAEIRFGGTMELGPRNNAINKKRVQGIVNAIGQYFPQIKAEMPAESKTWHGFRPCSPDGLPFIGKINGLNNLMVATGHGMMGISLGPATGKLVSQIILEQKPEMDITAFDVNRFSKT